MFKFTMIILGLVFVFAGFSSFLGPINPDNSVSLISILSGLLLIAQGIKYLQVKKEENMMGLTEYKIYASRLYLKGKSDKYIRQALSRKGLTEEEINQLIG